MLLGVVLAILTFVFVLNLSQPKPGPSTPTPTTNVVVAVEGIPERVPVPPTALSSRAIPKDLVPPGAVLRPEDAIGKLTITRIYPGEIILSSRLATGTQAGLAFAIPKNKVAVAIEVDILSGVAGAIQENDTVDLISHIELVDYDTKGNKSETEPTTFTALRDIKVLHVGVWTTTAAAKETKTGATGQTATGAIPLTLLVDPQDADLIKFLIEQAKGDKPFYIALRRADDRDIIETEPVTRQYLIDRFGLPVPPLIIKGK